MENIAKALTRRGLRNVVAHDDKVCMTFQSCKEQEMKEAFQQTAEDLNMLYLEHREHRVLMIGLGMPDHSIEVWTSLVFNKQGTGQIIRTDYTSL